MNETWQAQQLQNISAGTSIFGYIPPEIGKVLYCDSTTGDINGDITLSKRIAYLLGGILGCASGLFFLLFGLYIISAILLIVLGIFLLGSAIFMKKNFFKCTDYIIGEKGFARITFKDTRSTIVTEEVIMFKDFDYLFTREDAQYQGGNKKNPYLRTVCIFSFYAAEGGFSRAKRLKRYEGTFKDKNVPFSDNPILADEEYSFLKKVEEEWSRQFIKKHRDNEVIYFPSINNNDDLNQRVTVYQDGISVFDNQHQKIDFKFDEITNVALEQDNKLTIETVTFNYALLANAKALLTLLRSKNVPVSSSQIKH